MGSMAREMTSVQREGTECDECLPGVQVSGPTCVGRSLKLLKTVTKPMLKDLLVFIYSLPYLSRWQDIPLHTALLGDRCALAAALYKCHSFLWELPHGDSSKDELSLKIYF